MQEFLRQTNNAGGQCPVTEQDAPERHILCGYRATLRGVRGAGVGRVIAGRPAKDAANRVVFHLTGFQHSAVPFHNFVQAIGKRFGNKVAALPNNIRRLGIGAANFLPTGLQHTLLLFGQGRVCRVLNQPFAKGLIVSKAGLVELRRAGCAGVGCPCLRLRLRGEQFFFQVFGNAFGFAVGFEFGVFGIGPLQLFLHIGREFAVGPAFRQNIPQSRLIFFNRLLDFE